MCKFSLRRCKRKEGNKKKVEAELKKLGNVIIFIVLNHARLKTEAVLRIRFTIDQLKYLVT